MKSFIFYLLTILVGLWIQIVLNHLTGGQWISFQVLLIAVIYWGLSRGPLVGQLMGFGWGMLMDASSLGFLGMHGLLWAAVGYLSGVFRRQLDDTKPWTQTLFTFAMSCFYGIGALIIDRLMASGDRPLQMVYIMQPLGNALIAAIAFWLLNAWDQVWDMRRFRD